MKVEQNIQGKIIYYLSTHLAATAGKDLETQWGVCEHTVIQDMFLCFRGELFLSFLGKSYWARDVLDGEHSWEQKHKIAKSTLHRPLQSKGDRIYNIIILE